MNVRGIIIVLSVLATVSTIAIVYLALENNIAKQNQAEELQARVHVFTPNGTQYVRISDLVPDSHEPFAYPFTGNSTFDSEASREWQLLRLPKDLGGDKDDISSFRAYSVLDIYLGCLVPYVPRYEKLVDPCNGDTFESVNGIAVTGLAAYQRYNALPNLDLAVDDEGYIYVKPPTFEFDKNGVIGAGRDAFHCTDPTQTNLQFDIKRLTTRQQIESIVLSDPRIQKIIVNNSCEFMSDGILYTENGTYRTININLNNTKELSAAVVLQNNSVNSYELTNLTRTYPAK